MFAKIINKFKKSKPQSLWLERKYLSELGWFDEYIARQSGKDAVELEKFRWAVRDLIERLYVFELNQGLPDETQRKDL